MLELNPSRPEDWPEYKALWQTAFGDEDAYIDCYFRSQYAPDRVLGLREDGVLSAMLVLFPLELRWPDGGLTRASYLYALATDPAARGKGYATFLMKYAEFYLAGQGVPFLSTVPAEPSLQPLFAGVGFQPCHPMDEAELELPAPGPYPAEEVDGAAYLALRESLLAGTAHAVYSETYLNHQKAVSALAGGGLYRMETPAGAACAVVERAGTLLEVRELLAPSGGQMAALAALAAKLPGKVCRVRCPAGRSELPGSTTRLFGMGKRVPPTEKRLGESYFSLAFD